MARSKRGKKRYTRKEVWEILGEIKKDLYYSNRYEQVTKEEIAIYFENYEL